MKIIRTDPFKDDYKRLEKHIQKKIEKQLRFLIENPRHPSLQSRKLTKDIWYARVNDNYRFTFWKKGDTFILRSVGPHPK